MTNVVILNADFTFLNFISWQKAITLLFQDKVDVVKYSERVVNSVSRSFKVPAVVKLIELAKIVYKRKVNFSKTNVFIRDGYKCAYCGISLKNNKKKVTIDHIVPKSAGGKDTWNNCVTACHSCNNRKGDTAVEEFGRLRINPYQPTVTQYIQAKLKLMGSYKVIQDLFKNL